MKLKDVLEDVSSYQIIMHFGTDEILSWFNDKAIEEDYLRRTPLGKALEE